MNSQVNLPLAEYEGRVEKLREHLRHNDLAAACVFDAMRIFYLTGFHRLADERPLVLIMPVDGEINLLVPHLEEENIPNRTPHIKHVHVYREYPGKRHPMDHLREVLEGLSLSDKRIGVDGLSWSGGSIGAGWYRGPSLSDIAPRASLTSIQDFIDDLRVVKSPAEIELIRRSAVFSNVAHALLQEHTHPGLTEIEVGLRASMEATQIMALSLGDDWEPIGRPGGAQAAFTSGPKSALNHRQSGARRVRKGDVLLTFAVAEVGGYTSELERILIVGEPTDLHRKYFDLEIKAQDAAFAAIGPGVRCSEVEAAVNSFLDANGLYELTRTHIGHGIGIDVHEAPFFSLGDETVLKPGMVMTVEPCLFLPGIAGFRHSDTLVITESGFEMITFYPRDLESLIVAA